MQIKITNEMKLMADAIKGTKLSILRDLEIKGFSSLFINDVERRIDTIIDQCGILAKTVQRERDEEAIKKMCVEIYELKQKAGKRKDEEGEY